MLPFRPDRAKAHPAAHPEYFEGRVAMQPLVAAADSSELEIVAVFFEDGARTIPHIHATDQVLLVVEGRCVVAEEDGRRELGPGDLVLLAGNQWHWHGAVRGQSMCHISFRKPGPTDWEVVRGDW